MADENCIKAILEAAPHLSREAAAQIDDAVALAKKQAGARAGMADADAAAIAFARSQGDEAVLAAMIEKRNRAINVVVETALRDFTGRDAQGARRLSAVLVGSVRGFEGAARSIDAEAKGLEAELLGALHHRLEDKGLRSVLAAADTGFERDLANELARLSDAAAGRDTGNAHAQAAARIFHELQEASRTLQNEAGGWIGSLPGYITRQSHDQHRIAKAGFERWRDTIRPLLDDRTFLGRADADEFLRGVWVNLASGNHLKPDSVGSFKDPAFKGPGNLAKKISAERVLHFRDADAWFAYNQDYGAASLLEAAAHGLRRAAQNTAILRRLGTNPEAMFDRLRDTLIVAAKKRNDLAEIKRLQSATLQAEFDQVSGAANVPESPTLAAWGSGSRAVLNMSSLGGVVLSSITDLPNAVGVLRRNGVPYLESWGGALKGFVAAAGAENRKAAELIGVGIDGALGGVLDRFHASDGVRGRLAKLQDRFFRLSLLSWWTDASKRGVGFMLARHLADHTGRGFDALPPALQANFRRYGIAAPEWEAMRRADMKAGDGEKFLMPDAMERLDAATILPLIADHLTSAETGLRRDLADRRVRDEAMRGREGEWAARRLQKHRDRLARAEERYAKISDNADARLQDRMQGYGERIELMRARLDEAEIATDILGAVRGMQTRDAVRQFLDAVEDGADPERVVGRSDRRIERDAGGQLRAGERLGERRGATRRRIVELEKAIRDAERKADAAREARSDDFEAYWKEKEDELQAFIDRIAERQAEREAVLFRLEDALPGRVAKIRKGLLADKRRELRTMLQTYYVGEVNEALTMPGAAEQALLRLGTRPGTGFGEAVRFFMQFKSFPVTYVNRQLGRTLLGGMGTEGGLGAALRSGKFDAPGLVHLMLASTVFGYLAMSAKDLAKGREPRSPEDYATWIAALKQGGGMGIYGDFLFGEYNRFGGGPVETLAGPGVGQAGQILRVLAKIRDGDDPSAGAVQAAKNVTPFLNLFYTRPALDYLFFYQLSESMNPGYLRRMEQRMARDNNQKFIFSPADAIPRGGGDRIGEGVR